MSIKKDVKAYLKLSGECQADLARRAGITPMTLTHYVTGRRIPKPANLEKLKAAMVWPLPSRVDATCPPGTNESDYPHRP